MPAVSGPINIDYISKNKLNSALDEIVNCEVSYRKSDLGFVDQSRYTLRPRAGSMKLGSISTSIREIGDFRFFTDDEGVRCGYVSKGGEVYKFTYGIPGFLLGRYADEAERASLLSSGPENSYFIVAQTLSQFQSGSIIKLEYEWTDEFDNEADLYDTYAVPEDDLFCYVRDTNSVYYSAGGIWNWLNENYTLSAISLGFSNDYPVYANVVSLPKTLQATDVALNASGIEKVKPSLLLGSPANYVGSFLMITSGIYKGKFGYILNYDTSTAEFLITSLGNATPVVSGTTYTIFAKKGTYIQFTNGYDNDKYYDGSAFFATIEGYVKTHLNKFTNYVSGGPGRILSYGNQAYTAIKDVIYISEVAQPLWYNINDTIPLQNGGIIENMFIWKNRFIVGGTNFNTIINASITAGVDRTIELDQSFGVVTGSLTKVLKDFWLLTTGGEIITYSENAFGSLVDDNNIGIPVRRYLQQMQFKCCSGFDGRRFFIYGENQNRVGYTCVYDTFGKFWAVYAGFTPARFVLEAGTMYYVEQGTGTLFSLVEGKVNDGHAIMNQYASGKETDLGDIYREKMLNLIRGYFENENQSFDYSVIARVDDACYVTDDSKTITRRELTGDESVIGYNYVETAEIVPHLVTFKSDNDKANSYKWEIRNTGNNGFYLNQLQTVFKVTDPDFIHTDF